MSSLLSILVNNLSDINNKKPTGEFIDNIRSMITSLSSNVDNLSGINKKLEKKSENKFIDNLRSISFLLLHNVDNLSEINKKNRKIRK